MSSISEFETCENEITVMSKIPTDPQKSTLTENSATKFSFLTFSPHDVLESDRFQR